MSIYQLKSRDYYIKKSLEDKNFRKNILSSVVPRSNIFLIDEHFSPISATNKHEAYLKVNIYRINKDDSETSMNLKDMNMYDMTITCEKFVTPSPTGYSSHVGSYMQASVIKFSNSYLGSEKESRKIQKIKDRMSFLKYVIEYK